jgi:hypothetical protein
MLLLQRSLDDKVDDVASTAYTMAIVNINYIRRIEASDERGVVGCGVIPNKTVKSSLEVVLSNSLKYE